jgi:hypothetical protein
MAEESQSSYATFYKKTSKRPRGILFLLSLVALILIGLFVALRFFSVDSMIASITQSEPTPTERPEPTPEPTVAPTEEPDTTPSPTGRRGSPTPTGKKGTPTPTGSKSVSGIDRSLLTVAVQNGSGESGAAKRIANELSAFGYKIGTVGNADAFDYTGITIQVKSTKGNYLEQLKKDLSEDYTVESATKDLPSSFSADALVIYGTDE